MVSGCDAQLRFETKTGQWWGVTLQAGAGGGCGFGGGPGAVWLHWETPTQFAPLDSSLFPSDRPFQAGRP